VYKGDPDGPTELGDELSCCGGGEGRENTFAPRFPGGALESFGLLRGKKG